MDGRKFDDFVRAFASPTNRRRFLRRGIIAVAVAGGLNRVAPTEAARRGYSGKVSLCQPDGGGGYLRVSVKNVLVPTYLAAGYLPDLGCCADADCGNSGGDSCSPMSCDPPTGACQVTPLVDGTTCTPDGPIDLCYSPYVCHSGSCSEGIPTICPAPTGPCIDFAGCDSSTGNCVEILVPDGVSCERQPGCALGICSSGVCQDPPALPCLSDLCHLCAYDDCLAQCNCAPVLCLPNNPECQIAACNPQSGCEITNLDGIACSGGTCSGGVCV